MVFGGHLDFSEQRVLLAVGTRRVETLDKTLGLTPHSGVSSRVLQLGIEGSVCVDPRLERGRGAKQRLDKTCKYLSYITDQCRVEKLCGRVSSVVGSGNPPHAPGRRGARATRLVRSKSRNVLARVHRSRGERGECGSVIRAKPGQATLAAIALVVQLAKTAAQPETGTDMGRAWALATPPAQAGVETEESP